MGAWVLWQVCCNSVAEQMVANKPGFCQWPGNQQHVSDCRPSDFWVCFLDHRIMKQQHTHNYSLCFLARNWSEVLSEVLTEVSCLIRAHKAITAHQNLYWIFKKLIYLLFLNILNITCMKIFLRAHPHSIQHRQEIGTKWLLTHLKILIKQSKFSNGLQMIVLFPAWNNLFWSSICTVSSN